MSDIKRYWINTDGDANPVYNEDDSGGWCQWEDVERLQADNARLHSYLFSLFAELKPMNISKIRALVHNLRLYADSPPLVNSVAAEEMRDAANVLSAALGRIREGGK